MFLHISCCLETFHKPFKKSAKLMSFVLSVSARFDGTKSVDKRTIPYYTNNNKVNLVKNNIGLVCKKKLDTVCRKTGTPS